MFYISPWMLYGVVLCTAYFVLFLFGFGRKTKLNKPRCSLAPVTSEVVLTEENQIERSDKDFEDVKREKDSQLAVSKLHAQIREGTSPGQISPSYKSGDDFKLPPSDKEENIKVESHVTNLKGEEIVQIQEACSLEFEGPVSFPKDINCKTTSKHLNANRPEDENNFGLLQFQSLQTNQEESKVIDQRISNIESQESSQNIILFDVGEHESTNMQRDCHPLESLSTSHESNRHAFVGNFAASLVTKAQSDAFSNIEFESTARSFADRISTEIIFDAVHEFVDRSHQRVTFPKVQELQRYAGDVVKSLIKDAAESVCLMRDMESFAVDLSEQVINEGMDQYLTNTKVEKVRKKKASLSEMKIFSECIVNEVVSDGIDKAAEQDNDAGENNDTYKEEKELSVLKQHDSTVEDCEVVRLPFISTSLQPHIGGVVENLVNGAICEAVSRIKTHMISDTTLESQVNNTVHDLMVSALNAAVVESRGQNVDDQVSVPEITEGGELVSDKAVRDAASQEEQPPLYKGSTSVENIVNGHVDHFEGSESVPNGCQTTPKICIRSENNTEINTGFDAVPDQAFSSSVGGGKVELREQKSSRDGGDYWRRSLILDLEENDELDESFGSEKSPTSTEESLTTPKHKGSNSDGDSEEFIDSSEDEVIDHAEEAKLGAVGGSHIAKNDIDNKEMEFVDDDDDDDDDDGDDSDEMFVPESMVDGLCVSKPKGKRKKKKKHKLLPRARIQSAGSHFNNAVVIDNGCGCIKLGLAGDRNPRVVQPMVYGIPKRYSLQLAAMDSKKDRKYGDAAALMAGVMQLEYPMSAGLVENWSDVEEIWEYMLIEEMGIEEGNHPIVITEVANNSRRNREKIAEILFEHLSVPAMYLANQLALSLYASGLTMGLCLSSGFSVSQAAAIYEGYILTHTVQQLDIGGQSLTDNLQKLLRENKGLNFSSSSGWQIVNNMKEKMTYVAADYSAELKQYNTNAGLTQFYTLPDGQTVDISSEMISTPEPLFAPETLLGVDDTVASQLPIHKLVNNAFKRCSPDLQENIYRNVVLSGGTTLLSGLTPRLQRELGEINSRIRGLRTPENRKYSAWIGGSILSSLSSFDGMYVTVDEYADHGARVVNQKCF